MQRTLAVWIVAIVAAAAGLIATPDIAEAATCADYATQAEAQAAADTRDADGDGIYCETLPCPCSTQRSPAPPEPPPAPAPDPQPPATSEPEQSSPPPVSPTADSPQCKTTRRVIAVILDRRRHRAILAHMRRAIRAGWPRILVLNRPGADERREQLLDDARYPTRPGMDRDEWPMAFARSSWKAHVAYVPSGQNRSAGAIIGNRLRPFCDGTRFRVVGRMRR